MAAMCVVLLLAYGGQWVWRRFTDWRAARLVDDPEAEALVKETFARSDREIHGLSAPDLVETRARFNELIGHEWPNQT